MRNLNKPNRYNVASIQAQQTLGGDVMQSDENGQYVEWRDYKWLLASHDFVRDQWKDLEAENASLKAEVERLTALIESNLNSSKVMMGKADAVLHERDNLKAEVERLRKAGDELQSLAFEYVAETHVPNGRHNRITEAWNEAKEGKNS